MNSVNLKLVWFRRFLVPVMVFAVLAAVLPLALAALSAPPAFAVLGSTDMSNPTQMCSGSSLSGGGPRRYGLLSVGGFHRSVHGSSHDGWA